MARFRPCALFPADRTPPATDTPAIQVQLSHLKLHRPGSWGACWLGDQLWHDLQLDSFFAARLGVSREGTDWEKVLRQRWGDLFSATFDVLPYDLTSTCFECDAPTEETDPRRFGYSRDKRGDCVQVIVALVVTPEGLPLAYEMWPGNTADKATLRDDAHAERQPVAQRTTDRFVRRRHRFKATVAMSVGRRSLPRRQPDTAGLLQLQQQRTRGHVLESALRIAPVPPLAECAAETRPMPFGMLVQQTANHRDVRVVEPPTLHDHDAGHVRKLRQCAG